MELSSPQLWNFFLFSLQTFFSYILGRIFRELLKSEKQKKFTWKLLLIFLQKTFSPHFSMTVNQAVKYKIPHTLRWLLINCKIRKSAHNAGRLLILSTWQNLKKKHERISWKTNFLPREKSFLYLPSHKN